MWLADLKSVWEGTSVDGVRGTELALGLLKRTQDLLGDGEFWRSDALAADWKGEACDPLSGRAYYFSLGGAAARARWEMRNELADAEVSPADVQQVMNALFAVAREYRGGSGWSFASAVLDGMRSALEEYRQQQQGDAEAAA